MTPQSATATHYFFCSVRRFHPDDAELQQALKGIITRAFEQEDKPMLEKQQKRMGTHDLWSLRPVLLPIDTAAVRARRVLDRLIEKETRSRS